MEANIVVTNTIFSDVVLLKVFNHNVHTGLKENKSLSLQDNKLITY